MDREQPPARGGVVFIGSSTIRLWKSLAADFPEHHVINRGFGGSEIVDSAHFAERVIFPYEPQMVFLRAGGNDIHAGKSAAQVFADYKEFVAKVHARLPKAKIVYISLSPAPSRWAERDENKALNEMIRKFSRGKWYLKYVETYDLTVGPDGEPRRELFVADMLHFNADGYRLMAERVRPVLPRK
jgi:lysophospholipase L1-like esterase